MTLRSWTVLVTLLLLGCTRNPATAEVTVPPAPPSDAAAPIATVQPAPTLTNPELRVIVPESEASSFYFLGPPPPTFFTPSDREIAAFEAKLPAFLRGTTPARRRPPTPLADRMPKYMRQYVGIVDASGAHRIWGNFFCDALGEDAGQWRKHVILVKDGGDCFFNVLYDPATETFDKLRVNGEG